MSLFRNNPYYHASIKRLIAAFGAMFTDITITKTIDNKKEQIVRVPIAYGPKHKWLSRLREDPDLKNNVQITLPRIAFEIVNYKYAAERKIGTQGQFLTGSIGDARTKLFNPVPYDITINLYSMCKSEDDSLQILEQILPYFAPSVNINLEMLPAFNIRKDVPIVLNGVTVDDTYEGTPQDLRTVVQTFTFTAKVDLFGPINPKTNIIKRSIADLGMLNENSTLTSNDDYRYIAEVDPFDANKEDPHTIDETWFGEEKQ